MLRPTRLRTPREPGGGAGRRGSLVVVVNDQDARCHTLPHRASRPDPLARSSIGRDSFSYTFVAPGRYDYFCRFHITNRGAIIVQLCRPR
ncbi:MAG: Cupredoxin 1 protein [Chloroflexi bacterium]|nr:Cupredoxin 1 protein [Chloroflexota bacterium]